MVQLIEQSRLAIDELVDTIGRVTIDTVLEMSAEQTVGPLASRINGVRVDSWSGMETIPGRLI